MICAARNEAHGFRVESWAEGRQRREDGADARGQPTNWGVWAGECLPGRPSLPRRSRIRKALRKPGFPLRWVRRTRFLRLRPGKKPLPSKGNHSPVLNGEVSRIQMLVKSVIH